MLQTWNEERQLSLHVPPSHIYVSCKNILQLTYILQILRAENFKSVRSGAEDMRTRGESKIHRYNAIEVSNFQC